MWVVFFSSPLPLLSDPAPLPSQTVADVRSALEAAEKLEKSGASKADIKAAWDKVASGAAAAASAVFQLSEAELAARSVAADKVLENFCDSNPDADECRVYDD